MKKRSFTLIELSIVVVLVAAMASIIFTGSDLIDLAKIRSVQKEYLDFSRAIHSFQAQHGCYPGDCNSNQVQDIFNDLNAVNCLTENSSTGYSFLKLNTGSIDSPTKRTCMMYSLQLSGYIARNRVNVNSSTTFSDSVAGVNIPFAKCNKDAAWDYRTASSAPQNESNCGVTYSSNNTTIIPTPVELGCGSANNFANNDFFLLRDSRATTGTNYDISITSGNQSSTKVLPGISSTLAYRLDKKFDDGLPYSGKVIGAKSSTMSGCNNTSSISATTNITNSVNYLDNKNINSGCLLAFLY